MTITNLDFNGIKNSSYRGPVALVQLVTGRNRSGKTGISEALRLALTNDAEIGATPAKQSLMVREPAMVVATGSGIECTWGFMNGKRKHAIQVDGMEVKSLIGNMPITVKDFWALTGEERWSLLEGVVGKFTQLPPASDPAPLRTKIKTLQNAQPPAEYTGKPLHAIRAELDAITTQIAEQKKIRTDMEAAKKKNADIEAERVSSKEHLQASMQAMNSAASLLEATTKVSQELYRDIFDWSVTESNALEGMGETLSQCATAAWLSATEHFKGLRAIDVWADNPWPQLVLSALGASPPQLGEIGAKIIEDNPAMVRVQKGLELIGIRPAASPEAANQAVVKAVETAQKALADKTAITQQAQSRYDRANAAQLLPTETVSDDAYLELIRTRDALQANIQTAQAWVSWSEGESERATAIKALQEQLTQADTEHAAYQKARADYLKKAIDLIETKANAVISELGWENLSVHVEQVGKRPTLTIKAGGIDVAAMSGAEGLAYGAAVINAIHEASNVKCPLLLIEAAEMDAPTLLAFMEALKKSRTKGNVLVASHVDCGYENTIVAGT